MSDEQPLPEIDPIDLAASAALDGEAPEPSGPRPDPAAVQARVEEFRSVRELLAGPIPLPPESVIDGHVAAALEALAPTSGLSDRDVQADAVVTPLARVRRRRPATWLAAAAAVAVVAALGAILVSQQDQGSQSTTVAGPVVTSAAVPPSSAGSSADVGQSPAAASAGPVEPPGSSTTTVAGSTVPTDLGAVTSPDELASDVLASSPELQAAHVASTTSVVSQQQAASSITPAPSTARANTVPAPSCDPAVRASTTGLGALVYSAVAHLNGVDIEVLVYESGAGTPVPHRLIAARTDSCEILVDQPI